MKYKIAYIVTGFIFVLLGFGFSNQEDTPIQFEEQVKIALRDVGNILLLYQGDSTSLILPVKTLESSRFQLAFEIPLQIHPDSLVNVVKQSFERSKLPQYYRVEVLKCATSEVAYSYEIKATKEKSIVPCSGRLLPNACYTIVVRFTKQNSSNTDYNFIVGAIGVVLVLIVLITILTQRKPTKASESLKEGSKIGSFKFYPSQHKLVKAASEIQLSKKECELLEILLEHINQIVTREELEKRIWEDQGVIVGRSLDTYVSKLRKKFKDDPTIKISNAHGVGYKLEVMD